MKSLLTKLAIALFVTAAAGSFGAATLGAAGPAPAQSSAKFEVRFMEGMIDHHAMAVEMAEMCVEKAVHPELESQCQQIIDSQSSQIELMRGWLDSWYDIDYQPEMKRGQERMLERMDALPPEEFEVEFMETMIRHHRTAIREADRCLDKAYHAGLLELCGGIIEEQSAEMRLFSSWLCEWYDECRFERRFR